MMVCLRIGAVVMGTVFMLVGIEAVRDPLNPSIIRIFMKFEPPADLEMKYIEALVMAHGIRDLCRGLGTYALVYYWNLTALFLWGIGSWALALILIVTRCYLLIPACRSFLTNWVFT
jgi:hypothetical protein